MTLAATDIRSVPSRNREWLLRRITRRPLGIASLAFLVLLVAAVAAADLVAPYDPLAQDLHAVLQGPSARHLLGTDQLGRDVLSRLLYGGRISILGVAYAVGVVLLVGVPVGLLAGYLGGRFDTVVRWVTDVVLALPNIITLLVVLAAFGQNQAAAMITFGFLGTPGMIRIVRAATIAIRKDLYITAARVSGLSAAQTVSRHILPRVTGPIIVRTSLFAGAALLTESGLAFLGLGVQEPRPAWGGMIGAASLYMSDDSWLLIPPGLTIALAVLALGLVGDTLRDVRGATAVVRRPRRANPPPARVNGQAPSLSRAVPATAMPPQRQPLLSVRDLCVTFPAATGETAVVQNVSFDIAPGETLGLVGESGCGKSVTGRAVLGLLPAGGRVASGECRFDGADLATLGWRGYQALRGAQIALISQEPVASLDPNFTAGNQVAQVIRRHRRVSKAIAAARAIDLLNQVGMTDPRDVARRYPHELSGGMAQRVCIAAALAGNPRLLIADEPTTALDVTVQAEVLDLLRDLQHDTGMSILLITHDWGVVADLCDRAVVMYAGQVVESTDVRSMFRQPLHPYTDGLLRANPHSTEVGQRLPAIPGTVPAPDQWPIGCHFHPRCPLATDECTRTPIAITEPTPGRLTRCLHHDRLTTEAHAR